MSIINKALWSTGLILAIALILITGQTNIRNFEKVQNSIEEIYKDRLVVKGLIYNLVTDLHKKELALVNKDSSFFSSQNKVVNERLLKDIQTFRNTKLTPKEDETLRRFSLGVTKLIEQEKKANLASAPGISKETMTFLQAQIDILYKNLDDLSQIQLNEGKRKLANSGEAVASMNFFERVENYFIIIFAALIFVILFVIPGEKKKALVNE